MRQEHSDDKKRGNILSPNKSIQLHHHVRVLGYFLRQGYQPFKKPLKNEKDQLESCHQFHHHCTYCHRQLILRDKLQVELN